MTKDQYQQTIDYLNHVVFVLSDREDYEALKENTDRLKEEIKRLEEKRDAL